MMNSNTKLHKPTNLAIKTRVNLIMVWSITIAFLLFEEFILKDPISSLTALIVFIILLITIISASFTVVGEADKLACKLGEPYGTLILTLSIVSIEVILISAMMLGPGENSSIAKDSIFSVMMIIMNLVLGLSILLGGMKHGEQEYNTQGTTSYLGMIIVLGGIGMILPNFIEGKVKGMFSQSQSLVISLLVIILYGMFLFFQIKRYKFLYMQPQSGFMEISFKENQLAMRAKSNSTIKRYSKRKALLHSIILIGMIIPIVLLSRNMAIIVDYGIKVTKLPLLLGGLLNAIIVFTPESITSIKAALKNDFQRTVNLCHGAFVSTLGLTLPAVLILGIVTKKNSLLGMNVTETTLFIITLLLSITTFSGKRTTPISGVMHLFIFAIFILLIF